jgi:HD-GYP domain-containing protein (c-di-GMP phosphodiesterase class II)
MSETRSETAPLTLPAGCRALLQDLAQALRAPLAVRDPAGRVAFATVGGASDERGGISAPIESEGQTLGELIAYGATARLRPLIVSLARELGPRLAQERVLDQMTDQLSQAYDEINLLYRFGRVLQPDESFAASAERLLGETAELVERRALIFWQPETEKAAWSIGPELETTPALRWVCETRPALEGIHADFARQMRAGGAAGPNRVSGCVRAPQGTIDYVVAAVHTRSALTGFVGAFRPSEAEPFETGELRLLECLAQELSNTATTRDLLRELREMLFNTVRGLVAAIDAKDEYTRGHSERVFHLSVRIGERLRLPPEQLQTLSWGSLLHDIGKIAIQHQILNKPARLTDEEYRTIQSHPERGCRVLEPIPQLRSVLPAIRHHHERVDGRGYPDGLAGEAIPLLARIIAVADTYDAITSTRAYREARSVAYACEQIAQGAGTQFDAGVARAFLEMAAEGGLEEPAEGDADRPAA